jgi:hypothetical protein
MTHQEQEQIKDELAKELKGKIVPESLAILKGEIREAVEKDTLAKQVIDEIQAKKPKSDAFLKHPATLLLLGFIFTSVLGGIFTSCWKGYEQDNERAYLATQTKCERERLTKTEEIKQKTDVKDEIIKRVAETNTAAEEILLYFEMEPLRKEQERVERTAYWKDATRAWKTNEKILRQRLLMRFSNPKVSELFDEMVSQRSLVGININNEHEAMAEGRGNCSIRIKTANECMIYITESLMPPIIKIMNEEILSDEQALRATRCADSTASYVNVNPGPQVVSHSKPAKAALASNPCPEFQRRLKLCGVEDHDTSQEKAQNTSLEAMNPCPGLRGMENKCQVERENAAKKSQENATHH